MLSAILHGKAGRVEIGEQTLSWRELFRTREDLLTSVFFGRLEYLSDPAQAYVLALLLGKSLSGTLGRLEKIQFWPRLEGLEECRYVEPDVVLSFNDYLVLVEVKPPYGGDQCKDQWRKEITALRIQNNECKSIIFLALGRNVPSWQADAAALESEFPGLQVVVQEWQVLKDELRKAMPDTVDGRDSRVMADWMEAFRLYGLRTRPEPFSDLLSICADVQVDAALSVLRHLPTSAGWEPLLLLAIDFEKGGCNDCYSK